MGDTQYVSMLPRGDGSTASPGGAGAKKPTVYFSQAHPEGLDASLAAPLPTPSVGVTRTHAPPVSSAGTAMGAGPADMGVASPQQAGVSYVHAGGGARGYASASLTARHVARAPTQAGAAAPSPDARNAPHVYVTSQSAALRRPGVARGAQAPPKVMDLLSAVDWKEEFARIGRALVLLAQAMRHNQDATTYGIISILLTIVFLFFLLFKFVSFSSMGTWVIILILIVIDCVFMVSLYDVVF